MSRRDPEGRHSSTLVGGALLYVLLLAVLTFIASVKASGG